MTDQDPKTYGKEPTEPRIETPVDREDLPHVYYLQAEITEHPIVKDQFGTLRYKQTDFDDHDYNVLKVDYANGKISRDDFMQLHRNIGYSLYGFDELFMIELDLIKLENAYIRPIEDILTAWNDAICDDWSACFELLASSLSTGDTESLDEVIELLRVAAYLQEEYANKHITSDVKFKRGDIVCLIEDIEDSLETEDGDYITLVAGVLGTIVAINEGDEQPITVAWINLNTINQCAIDELKLYNIEDDFPANR